MAIARVSLTKGLSKRAASRELRYRGPVWREMCERQNAGGGRHSMTSTDEAGSGWTHEMDMIQWEADGKGKRSHCRKLARILKLG